jgi:Holliday junction resolvasome RuvABC endonuclease subunit
MAVNKILGVDPGTTNLGYCLIDAKDASIITQGTISIAVDSKIKGAHAKVAIGVVDALREHILAADYVVAEQQMKVKMGVVFGAAVGAAAVLARPVAGVAPCPVKRHFGLPLRVPYAAHKRNAIEKAIELGAESVTSHAADAYLCARYAAEVILKTKATPKYERQSSVSDRRRRVRGPRVLPVRQSVVRMPLAKAVR